MGNYDLFNEIRKHGILDRKSQASFEFIVIFAVLLIIFIAVLGFSMGVFSSIRQSKITLPATEMCERIAWSINEIYFVGDGGFSSIYIPAMLPETSYFNLTVYPNNRLIEIRWQNQQKHYTSPLATSNISGSLVIHEGYLNITNIDGGIYLEQ